MLGEHVNYKGHHSVAVTKFVIIPGNEFDVIPGNEFDKSG